MILENRLQEAIGIVKNEITMRCKVFAKQPIKKEKKVEEMYKVKRILEGFLLVAQDQVLVRRTK